MARDDKRLFFALWPDQSCRRAIVERTGPIVRASGGRAVDADNLHMTLAFLHSVNTSLIPCIVSAAKRAAGQSFNLRLSQTGYWHRSRLLWLSPAAGDAGTTIPAALADALWSELVLCGFTPEQRRYQPHLTLARKVNVPGRPGSIAAIDWVVNRFVLVESITGLRQSRYRVLESFALHDDPDISM